MESFQMKMNWNKNILPKIPYSMYLEKNWNNKIIGKTNLGYY